MVTEQQATAHARASGGARRRWSDDRGAGTIEYQGVLVVAALLVGVVVGSTTLFPEQTQAALCQVTSIVGGGDCTTDASADAPPTDADLHPGVCMLAESSRGGGVGVDIAFVTLGGDWGLSVTQYNEEYHARLTNGASGGVKAEVEGEAGVAGLGASASAEITYQHGDTWIVPADEWPQFEENAREYFDQTPWRWAGAGTLWGARPPRDPDVTSHEGGAQAEVAAEAKVGVEIPGEDPKRGGGVTAAGASAQASGGISVKREDSTLEDSVTWTYTMTGAASASASVAVAGGTAQISREGSLSVKRSTSGELLEITFETAARGGVAGALGVELELDKEGSGRHAATQTTSPSIGVGNDETDVVVTTTTLEVTDENREFVESWLDERDGGLDAALPMEPVVPRTSSADDAMLQELYEHARTTRNVYDASDTTASMGVGVSAGVGGGFEISGTEGSREVRTGEFLGSPREDGTRPFLPNEMCS